MTKFIELDVLVNQDQGKEHTAVSIYINPDRVQYIDESSNQVTHDETTLKRGLIFFEIGKPPFVTKLSRAALVILFNENSTILNKSSLN